MNPAIIMLLDLDSNDGCSESLQRIIESAFASEAEVKQMSCGLTDSGTLCIDLSEVIPSLHPDMVIVILGSGGLGEAGAVIESIRVQAVDIPVIVVVREGEADVVLELLRLGASDFVAPPLRAIDIVPRAARLLDQRRRPRMLFPELKERLGLKQLIGESPAFLAQIERFPLVAKCDASILILGESGTGKEVCARAIHYLSPRSGKPFVPVNCGALPTDLVENELFGHEREAFTGASTARRGLIQEADGGTLFLDEIDCLSLLAQVKLLRFLQEKEFRPLGSTVVHHVDVRVIAASNTDLEEAVSKGKLRRDLYYRLNVIPFSLPLLRDRPEDIPLLARHFLVKYADKFNKRVIEFSHGATQVLLEYEWPGNVRELEHIVERAIVLAEQQIVRRVDLCLPRSSEVAPHASFQQLKARTVARFERGFIEGLLRTHRGNVARAAGAAQKDRRAFRQLIRKHKIDVRAFRESA